MEEQNIGAEIIVPENIKELRDKMNYGIASTEDVLEYSKWREAQRTEGENDESLKGRIEKALEKVEKQKDD